MTSAAKADVEDKTLTAAVTAAPPRILQNLCRSSRSALLGVLCC